MLHRMDRSHDTLQLKMIVTLQRMQFSPMRNSDYNFSQDEIKSIPCV